MAALAPTHKQESEEFCGSILGKIFPERFRDLLFAQSDDKCGKGGQGSVTRVQVKGNCEYYGEYIALKEIHIPENDDKQARRLAYQEIDIMRACMGHPYVVPFICACVGEEKCYIAMQYIENGDLNHYMAQIKKDPKKREQLPFIAYNIFLGVAMVMLFSQQRGLAHGDIKPQNILIDDQGNPRVADFGLARLFVQASMIGVGTPAYMAPEHKITEKGDVYSLGMTMKEVIGDAPPPAMKALIDECLMEDLAKRINIFDVVKRLIEEKDKMVGEAAEKEKADKACKRARQLQEWRNEVLDVEVRVANSAKEANRERSLVQEQYVEMMKRSVESIRDQIAALHSAVQIGLDSKFGVLASLQARQPWTTEKTVVTRLYSNDLYNILDDRVGRGFKLADKGSMIEIRLEKPIKPAFLLLHIDGPSVFQGFFEGTFTRVEPTGKETLLFSGCFTEEMALNDDSKSGSVFRLYRTDQYGLKDVSLTYLDFLVEDQKPYFKALLERQQKPDPHLLPVFLSATMFDTNSLFDVNSGSLVSTLSQHFHGDCIWVEVELLKHELTIQGCAFRLGIEAKSLVLQGYNETTGEWISLGTPKHYDQNVDVKIPVDRVFTSRRFRLSNGTSRLALYYFDLFGELIRIK